MSGIPRPAQSATAVLEHIRPGSDLIVQCANGEPVTVLDAVEAAAPELERVCVHQEHFERGTVDLVPNDLAYL